MTFFSYYLSFLFIFYFVDALIGFWESGGKNKKRKIEHCISCVLMLINEVIRSLMSFTLFTFYLVFFYLAFEAKRQLKEKWVFLYL